jgi:hypothetical protein
LRIRYEHNIAEITRKIKVKQGQLQHIGRALKSLLPDYKGEAKTIVLQTVYAAPENPDFPRSMDTLESVDADMPDDNTIRIFLNPDLAVGNTKFPGLQSYAYIKGSAQDKFKYYPAFVRRGIFFRKRAPGRDFLAGWHSVFKPKFAKDVKNKIAEIVRG